MENGLDLVLSTFFGRVEEDDIGRLLNVLVAAFIDEVIVQDQFHMSRFVLGPFHTAISDEVINLI